MHSRVVLCLPRGRGRKVGAIVEVYLKKFVGYGKKNMIKNVTK